MMGRGLPLDKLVGWMPVMLAFGLPFHPRSSTWLFLLFLPFWIASGVKKKWKFQMASSSQLSMIALYLWMAIGMLWTSDLPRGWFALEVKASMLLIPLIFLTSRMRPAGWKRAWVIGCALMVAFRGVAYALGWDGAGWRYADWTGPFHPTYLAMYWGWAICLTDRHVMRWLIPIFAAAVGLAASKAGWLGGLFALGLAWTFGREFRWPVATGVLSLLCFGALADQGRLSEFVHHAPSMEQVESVEETPASKGSTGGRVQAWTVAGQVWLEHLLAGTGPGDFESEVLPRYKSAGMEYAAVHRLNAHSVYLQTLVTSGLVGLVLLMGWWGAAARIQWNRRDWGGLGCLILLFFNGLFESLLELQQGIVAVVFVTFVLSAPYKVESELQS